MEPAQPAPEACSSSSGDSRSSSRADEEMAERAQRLMIEKPTASEVVHNLFAALVAEGFADTQTMTTLARTLLKALSAFEMPDVRVSFQSHGHDAACLRMYLRASACAHVIQQRQ
jgi:hypothetical protein